MGGRHRYLGRTYTFNVNKVENDTYVASLIEERRPGADDDVGALYYVVAVILIYGCSILMMIASYIRKNNTDRKLNRYLKEMAHVRKRERQLQLMNAAQKANMAVAKTNAKSRPLKGSEKSSPQQCQVTDIEEESDGNTSQEQEGSRKSFSDLPRGTNGARHSDVRVLQGPKAGSPWNVDIDRVREELLGPKLNVDDMPCLTAINHDQAASCGKEAASPLFTGSATDPFRTHSASDSDCAFIRPDETTVYMDTPSEDTRDTANNCSADLPVKDEL